jgi:aldose 1-epimerase
MPGGETATLWLDASYPFLMLFTGDTLPDAARRRRSLGVEPMTCAPNAFQSRDGLRTLAPGESISCAWGITPGTDRSDAGPVAST